MEAYKLISTTKSTSIKMKKKIYISYATKGLCESGVRNFKNLIEKRSNDVEFFVNDNKLEDINIIVGQIEQSDLFLFILEQQYHKVDWIDNLKGSIQLGEKNVAEKLSKKIVVVGIGYSEEEQILLRGLTSDFSQAFDVFLMNILITRIKENLNIDLPEINPFFDPPKDVWQNEFSLIQFSHVEYNSDGIVRSFLSNFEDIDKSTSYFVYCGGDIPDLEDVENKFHLFDSTIIKDRELIIAPGKTKAEEKYWRKYYELPENVDFHLIVYRGLTFITVTNNFDLNENKNIESLNRALKHNSYSKNVLIYISHCLDDYSTEEITNILAENGVDLILTTSDSIDYSTDVEYSHKPILRRTKLSIIEKSNEEINYKAIKLRQSFWNEQTSDIIRKEVNGVVFEIQECNCAIIYGEPTFSSNDPISDSKSHLEPTSDDMYIDQELIKQRIQSIQEHVNKHPLTIIKFKRQDIDYHLSRLLSRFYSNSITIECDRVIANSASSFWNSLVFYLFDKFCVPNNITNEELILTLGVNIKERNTNDSYLVREDEKKAKQILNYIIGILKIDNVIVEHFEKLEGIIEKTDGYFFDNASLKHFITSLENTAIQKGIKVICCYNFSKFDKQLMGKPKIDELVASKIIYQTPILLKYDDITLRKLIERSHILNVNTIFAKTKILTNLNIGLIMEILLIMRSVYGYHNEIKSDIVNYIFDKIIWLRKEKETYYSSIIESLYYIIHEEPNTPRGRFLQKLAQKVIDNSNILSEEEMYADFETDEHEKIEEIIDELDDYGIIVRNWKEHNIIIKAPFAFKKVI